MYKIKVPQRGKWAGFLTAAADIVGSYPNDRITLRQVHYQLASKGIGYPNTKDAYRDLGRYTAQLRREGRFPRLVDNGREIDRPLAYDSVNDAIDSVLYSYRLDRTKGQENLVYVVIEKRTLQTAVARMVEDKGIPVVALGGSTGEELVTDVAIELAQDLKGRKPILIYGGDFDPSGFNIPANFLERLGFYGVQVDDYAERFGINHDDLGGLPQSIQPAKEDDPNYGRFVEQCWRWGVEPCQVELEALPPEELERRVTAAVAPWWDATAHAAVLAQEEQDKATIRGLQ